MPFYTDQLNRTIEVTSPPKRIISLVPSQTELLFDLGLEEEVVGITKFCVHPQKWFWSKKRIGGTKNVQVEEVAALEPDLIIANKEENVKEQVEQLAKDFPVWTSDVNNLDDALQMIEAIGTITGKQDRAHSIASGIQNSFAQLTLPSPRARTAYLIWKEPYMSVGGDTFIHHMLQQAGFQNVFQNTLRYPQVTIDDLKEAAPELLFLSSEPYPFKQKHVDGIAAILTGTKVLLVDGELFSWYGSRLQKAPGYFKALHQQVAAML